MLDFLLSSSECLGLLFLPNLLYVVWYLNDLRVKSSLKVIVPWKDPAVVRLRCKMYRRLAAMGASGSTSDARRVQ